MDGFAEENLPWIDRPDADIDTYVDVLPGADNNMSFRQEKKQPSIPSTRYQQIDCALRSIRCRNALTVLISAAGSKA